MKTALTNEELDSLVVGFGPHKGKKLTELTDQYLASCIKKLRDMPFRAVLGAELSRRHVDGSEAMWRTESTPERAEIYKRLTRGLMDEAKWSRMHTFDKVVQSEEE
jgi:hypothetical protein